MLLKRFLVQFLFVSDMHLNHFVYAVKSDPSTPSSTSPNHASFLVFDK